MRTFTARSGMPGPHGAAVASQGTKGGESPASEARAGQRDCGSGVSKCVKTPPSYGFDKIRAACKAVYAGSIPTLASKGNNSLRARLVQPHVHEDPLISP